MNIRAHGVLVASRKEDTTVSLVEPTLPTKNERFFMNKYHPQYLQSLQTISKAPSKYIELILVNPPIKQQKFMPLLVFYPFRRRDIYELISSLHIETEVSLDRYKISPQKAPWKFLLLENGAKQKGKSAREMKMYTKKSKLRGLTLIEGLWLVAAYPEILKDHAVDMIATTYSLECVPTLYLWNNRRHLSAISPDVHDALCGAPIVYKEIQLHQIPFADSGIKQLQYSSPSSP
ncbi:hypothetical protein HY409_03980 [Candidatus Gottesmanbacteria bacterium]|nr:hypothetical protein [Candidatus Gottesmanbacteria bacterium]